MTKDEVITLEDALRFDCEKCTETIKEAWACVKSVHSDRPAAQQVMVLHGSLMKTFRERPEFLFSLMNAVLGKFLLPELTPEEQYNVRMYDIRRKDNG